MTKTLFVTLMTEITSSVATFETWLDAVEKAFGDAAATTILEKADPYARVSMMAALTGWDIDVLLEKVNNQDSDWDEFWDNSRKEEEA